MNDYIISLIIQEEKKKEQLEKERQYEDNVLYIDPPMYDDGEGSEKEEEIKRGVVVIDI